MASSVHERMKETAALGAEIPETGWAYQDGVFKRLADAHVSLDARAQLRHRRLRGHPCLLEREP